jgi:hypothetical protein
MFFAYASFSFIPSDAFTGEDESRSGDVSIALSKYHFLRKMSAERGEKQPIIQVRNREKPNTFNRLFLERIRKEFLF